MNIVESLIVELGLDPSGFIAGRRNIEHEMRALRNLARVASDASTVDQRNIRKQFDNLATSAGISKDQLNNLWTDLRKNATAATKPIDNATLSTRSLAAAGIAAYAAFKTVKGVIDGIGSSINSTIGTGFAARFAGTPVQWISAFSTAAFNKTGAAKEQTEGWIADLRTELEGFQTPGSPTYGKWTGRMNALAMMGLDATTLTRDPQELISQISQHLSTLDPTKQRAAAQGLGLPDRLGAFMGEGRTAVNNQTAAAAAVAVTKEQTEKLGLLGGALRSVDSSWDGLTRTITTAFAPAMTAVLKQFDQFLIDLQTSKERMDVFQGSVSKIGIGGALGGFLGLLGGGFKGLLHGTWVGAMLGLSSDVLASPGTSLFPSHRTPAEEQEYRRRRAEETNEIGRGTPPLSRFWNWMTGKKTSEAAPSGGGPRGDPRNKEASLRALAIKHGLNPDEVIKVARAEGLGAANYGTWDVNGMSYGALQGHIGGLATDFHRATGIDPSKPENEDALNDWLLGYAAKNGWNKWSSVTTGKVPRPAPARAPAAVTAAALTKHGPLPPGTPRNSRGDAYAADLTTIPQEQKDQVAKTMAWIKSHPKGVWGTAHAAQIAAGGGGGTVNHGDVNVNVGDIHTQAADAATVARDLKGELEDQFSVTHSNVGVE